MSENVEEKQEVTDLTSSDIADMAQNVALQVEGVKSLNLRLYDEVVDGISERLGQKSIRGIKVKQTKDSIDINIYLIVYYGYNVITIGKVVQKEIQGALQPICSNKSIRITVHIADMVNP